MAGHAGSSSIQWGYSPVALRAHTPSTRPRHCVGINTASAQVDLSATAALAVARRARVGLIQRCESSESFQTAAANASGGIRQCVNSDAGSACVGLGAGSALCVTSSARGESVQGGVSPVPGATGAAKTRIGCGPRGHTGETGAGLGAAGALAVAGRAGGTGGEGLGAIEAEIAVAALHWVWTCIRAHTAQAYVGLGAGRAFRVAGGARRTGREGFASVCVGIAVAPETCVRRGI